MPCAPDGEKQAAGDDNQGEYDTGGNCQDRTKKQNNLKGKAFKSNTKNTAKPSFPAKKRVQVPKRPLSETPTRLAQFEGKLCEIAKEPRGSSTILKKPALGEEGETMLSPFFWLREEEDVEKSSQQTDEDQLLDMPPVNVPAFSDIKDSDDEYSPNLTPTVSA